MYGLAICRKCKKARVVDLFSKSSTCPYCNRSEKTESLSLIFQCDDQETAREALAQTSGFEAPDDTEKRKRIEESDPYSTMIYKYEHSSDLDEKMRILAKGLTEVKGTFTLDDVREIVGEKHAEKYVSAMLDRCYISEVRIGQYKA